MVGVGGKGTVLNTDIRLEVYVREMRFPYLMSSFFLLFLTKAYIGNYRFSAVKKMSLRLKLQFWKTYNIIIRT